MSFHHSNTNEKFLAGMVDTIGLLFQPLLWIYFALLALPIYIIFELNSGIVFTIFLIACGLFSRNAKLGALLGWFIVSVSIFLFYYYPEPNHFIEFLLRAPATAHSNPISSQYVQQTIPITLLSKMFWSLIFGLRGGFIIGLGLGFLGRKLWGCHPKIS